MKIFDKLLFQALNISESHNLSNIDQMYKLLDKYDLNIMKSDNMIPVPDDVVKHLERVVDGNIFKTKKVRALAPHTRKSVILYKKVIYPEDLRKLLGNTRIFNTYINYLTQLLNFYDYIIDETISDAERHYERSLGL